jgi:hypothetical protein
MRIKNRCYKVEKVEGLRALLTRKATTYAEASKVVGLSYASVCCIARHLNAQVVGMVDEGEGTNKAKLWRIKSEVK